MSPELLEIKHFCGAKHLDCWGAQLYTRKLASIDKELKEFDDDGGRGQAVVLYLADEQLYHAYGQATGEFDADWLSDDYPERAEEALDFLRKHGFQLMQTYVNPNSENIVHMFVRPGQNTRSTDWF